VKRHNKLTRRATIRGSGIDAGNRLIPFNGRIQGHTLGPGKFVAVADGSARGVRAVRFGFTIARP
jgi:hypothetical protein